MKLLIVESPNKVKKIQHILDDLEPRAWNVVPTVGHWRGLPPMDGGTFANAVDPSTWKENFVVHKDDVASKLRSAIGAASAVFLASDPDREGEAIAWHVVDHFRLRGARRVLFTEITKTAIAKAIANAGEIDSQLVDAQRARAVLDYEFGLEVSRRLWRFGCRSAGRVQSAALRIVIDREVAIRNFKPVEFWTVNASYGAFDAQVATYERMSDEEADDVGSENEERLTPKRFATKAEADALVAAGRNVRHVVESVVCAPHSPRPPPPFTTSSLQAGASTRFKWDPDKTARVAQALFEKGLITYIRTDSTAIAEEALVEIRAYIAQHHAALLPKEPQRYADKAGAQGAHECIRPVHMDGADVASLSLDERTLYQFIHDRTLACQLASAVIDKTNVVVAPEGLPWRLQAQGSVVREPGFLALGIVPDGTNSDDELPALKVGDILSLEDLSVEGGKTKAPPRFTDASLIRYLERKRIGRPSTFASIIKTLFDRDYVKKLKQHLTPTDHGELADRLTRVSFDLLTQEPFTATTEKSLDKIAAGHSARSEFLAKWHVGLTTMLQAAEGHLAAYAQRHPELDRDAVQPHDTPCVCGAPRVKRNGKFGEYAQCTSEACGKRQSLAPLVEIDDPCPDCGGAVVEQPYMKERKKKVFYRCSSCAWKSSFKPPKLTEWPCHVDESHGCMVEVTYMKEGSKKQFLLCTTCQNKAWTGPKPPACPACSTPGMRLLNGPNGQFWGCSAFKETACKGVLPFELPAKKKKPGRAKTKKAG